MGIVDVILEDVEPEDGSPFGPRYLTAWPNQIGVIICDGKVEEVFSGGKRELPKGEVWTYIAYTAPIRLTFWLKDPDDSLEPEEGVILDQPALTADGQPVTGRIEIVFSVIQDSVELLLQLLARDGSDVTTLDLANMIKGELLAKVLMFDIYSYTASQLRGNQGLFREMYDSLKRELASTIGRYGLRLDNFFVTWGLTPEEREGIKEQRHKTQLEDIRREQELDSARRYGGQPERRQGDGIYNNNESPIEREDIDENPHESVPPSGSYDLYLGPEFEKLSSQGKGKQARAAYLRSVGIHPAKTPGRQWVQRGDRKWLCIAYSSEVAPGQWFFTLQKTRLEEKLADGSMSGAAFLCAIGSGRLIVKEMGVERIKNVLHKLSYTPKDDFLWFMLYRRDDGRYHLENGRTLLDEIL